MTLILRICALVAGLVATVMLPPWSLLFAWLAPLPDSVDKEVQHALEHGFDGIIVYVEQGGQPPSVYSAGWHDREARIPAKGDALFKIASINKLYLAVAAVKLVEQSRLSLDVTLSEYFPRWAGRIPYADKITVRHLIQHRSGLANFTDTPGYWQDPPANSDDALALIFDQPASFAPGQTYGYSNTNYLLIGALIEHTTGQPYQRFIDKAILGPLALYNTFHALDEVDISRVMGGYYVGLDENLKTTDYGSMLATAADVGRFIRALNDGSVFSGQEQAIYDDVYVYEHTGLIPGYQSIARYHPDIDAVVVQFINTTDFSDYTHWALSERVYSRIIEILRRQQALQKQDE
ncbi:serine hydrolase domain-containing protein [Fluctibacter halophilus]|uniref:serine hydrolase domain-containing protein n=1 Tax=Fluctibacter halophilus TaxID=226011 RepID=UPI001E658C4C|nr:serine hydrolase domain-containing protein [Aestuariibacter halophilus]